MKKLLIILLGSILFINIPYDSIFAKGKKRSQKKQQTQIDNRTFYHLHFHIAAGPSLGWFDETNSSGGNLASYKSDLSIGNLSLSFITQYAPDRIPLGLGLSVYLDNLNHSYEGIDKDIAGDSILSTGTSFDLFFLIDYLDFGFFGAGSFFYIVGTDINTSVYDPKFAWGLILGTKYRLVNSFALLFQASYQKMFETKGILNGTDTMFNGSILRISLGISFTIKMFFPSFI